MTKTIISTIIIVGCVAVSWLSLKTEIKTNQEASASVMQALDEKIETYRSENAANFAAVIAEVDMSQGKTLEVAEQVRGIADSLVGIAKAATELGQQNKQLLEGQTQVLQEHTQSLEEVKTRAKEAKSSAAEAVDTARRNQIRTQKAIQQINKPKKNWWSGMFSAPAPSPNKH